jgi:hypothetical protein
MGMEPKNYLSAIKTFCEYIENGTSDYTNLQGKVKNGEIAGLPEKGHTVVLSYKPQTTTCDWCYDTVQQPNLKIFARDFGSQIWEGKCKTCKQKRTFKK